MQPDSSTDLLVDDSPGASRTSTALILVAALALLGNCLLNSPSAFSAAHETDTSLLKPVVTALALGGAFPTARGVELHSLIFYTGAAVLALIAAIRLASSTYRPRLSGNDLLDLRRRAASPYFWWCLLLLVSVLSSYFSHAPEVCKGQTVIRFLHLAWWWPLAALVVPQHGRRLATLLLTVLGLTAALGVWYYLARNAPGTRLRHPIGNELWLAACLLPGLFVAFGLLIGRLRSPSAGNAEGGGQGGASVGAWPMVRLAALAVAVCTIIAALYFARSRSALVGLAAGAFAFIALSLTKTVRRIVVLVALLLALGAAVWIQDLRSEGVMGRRAHSIRARLNHEWPYALTLFFSKPVAGNGDGAYALRAGQFGREDQLDDPAVMAFDERSWIGHAHNEYLQLLADLGVVGALAFVAALVLTIYRALQFCDRTRDDREAFSNRWLVIGLAGALIALAFEEGSSMAFREPGLPPIFLTVWAALWVLVRGQQRAPEPKSEDRRLGNLTLRLGGVGVGVCAVILGYFGVQDWRAARAIYETDLSLRAGDYTQAMTLGDFAAGNLLDPFRNIIAQRQAVLARSGEFARRLADSKLPPTNEDLAFAQNALGRLTQLDDAAPRFLGSARLRAELSRNLASAHRRRGESGLEREALRDALQALQQHQADEPFRIDVVELLWLAKRDGHSVERLEWLRCLLRGGGADQRFMRMFRELLDRADFVMVVNDLFNVAIEDQEQPPDKWMDPLSPETFRIAALSKALTGELEEATSLARTAVTMYQEAGPRLFAAHAAALNEMVGYDFRSSPTARTEDNLILLAEAQTILSSPAEADQALPGALGQTRLQLLLGAGREEEAQEQLAKLDPQGVVSAEQLAESYAGLAALFANRPQHLNRAINWAQQAIRLAPDQPHAHGVLVRLLLHRAALDQDATAAGRFHDQALESARRFLELLPDRQAGLKYLGNLQAQYPASPMWAELRRLYPQLPAPPPAEPPVQSEDADVLPAPAGPTVPGEGTRD